MSRGVYLALVFLGEIGALTFLAVILPHHQCDPLSTLPWLRCGAF
jgi:hypothetical protein